MIRQSQTTLERSSFKASNTAKIAFGLCVLVSIASRGDLDPTVFNLVTSDKGVQNWLGLPGALLGGALYDGFGWLSLSLPAYLLFVRNRDSTGIFRILSKNAVNMLLLTSLAGLLTMGGDTQTLRLAGLWGLATNRAMVVAFGRTTALFIVGFLIIVHNYGFWGSYRFDRYVIIILSKVLLISVLTIKGAIQLLFPRGLARSAVRHTKRLIWTQPIKFAISAAPHVASRTANFFAIRIKKGIPLSAKRKYSGKKTDSQPVRSAPEIPRQVEPPPEERVYATEYRNRLYQALVEFKKTNFPGNDIEIKTLEKL